MKALLHICCAPCTVYTLKSLRSEGIDVTGYFYNPNIHPLTEFRKRLITLESFAATMLLPLAIDKEYSLENFLQGALEQGEDRCLFCYKTRLNKAFQKAVDNKVDAVTTTLLYSKYQRHDDIKRIGDELSDTYKVRFLYRDFRAGWKEGIEESKRVNMYRQQYCGCIFSERDRYKES
jgi:hypothetical protein